MAKYSIDSTTLEAISSAIKAKRKFDASTKIQVKNFANGINSISASDLTSGTKSITSNGKHTVTSYKYVNVQVPTDGGDSEISLSPTITVTPGKTSQTISASDEGYDGLSEVVVEGDSDLISGNIKKGITIFGVTGNYTASSSSPTLQAKTVTPSSLPATVTADSGYDGLSSVTINKHSNLTAGNIRNGVTIFGVTGNYSGSGTSITLQNKTVTPTTSQQSVSADSGYTGLGTVTVNAMPTATQATPSISVNAAGLITASAAQSAGYVASGTKSATKQLTTKGATSITPSTSSQTAVPSGVYTTGTITVNPIPSDYIKPSGTKTISSNGTHDVKTYEKVNVQISATNSGLTHSGQVIVRNYTPFTLRVFYVSDSQGRMYSGTIAEDKNLSFTCYSNDPDEDNSVFFFIEGDGLSEDTLLLADGVVDVSYFNTVGTSKAYRVQVTNGAELDIW